MVYGGQDWRANYRVFSRSPWQPSDMCQSRNYRSRSRKKCDYDVDESNRDGASGGYGLGNCLDRWGRADRRDRAGTGRNWWDNRYCRCLCLFWSHNDICRRNRNVSQASIEMVTRGSLIGTFLAAALLPLVIPWSASFVSKVVAIFLGSRITFSEFFSVYQ